MVMVRGEVKPNIIGTCNEVGLLVWDEVEPFAWNQLWREALRWLCFQMAIRRGDVFHSSP